MVASIHKLLLQSWENLELENYYLTPFCGGKQTFLPQTSYFAISGYYEATKFQVSEFC